MFWQLKHFHYRIILSISVIFNEGYRARSVWGGQEGHDQCDHVRILYFPTTVETRNGTVDEYQLVIIN